MPPRTRRSLVYWHQRGTQRRRTCILIPCRMQRVWPDRSPDRASPEVEASSRRAAARAVNLSFGQLHLTPSIHEGTMGTREAERFLIRAGFVLFTLALLTGFAVP